MTNTPTTSEPKTPKVQFSLFSLMLWVTVVGIFFGSARWIPQISPNYAGIPVVIFMVGSVGIYFIYLFYGLKMTPSTDVLILASGFSIPVALFICILGGLKSHDLSFAIVFHHGSWSTIFIISIAAIISIRHCKKQAGSWFPFVGEKGAD